MLLAGAMPPWYADPTEAVPATAHAHAARTRQGDHLGGAERTICRSLPDVQPRKDWAGGSQIRLPMPQAFTVAAGVMKASNRITIATTVRDAKWVKGADLMPGVAAMVRRAYISMEGGPILQVWEPGDDVVDPPSGAAFKLPAGAKIHLKVDYKKSWQDDRRRVGQSSSASTSRSRCPQVDRIRNDRRSEG